MTPEMQLAQALGHKPKTKLSSYMEERSLEELENVLRVEFEKKSASKEWLTRKMFSGISKMKPTPKSRKRIGKLVGKMQDIADRSGGSSFSGSHSDKMWEKAEHVRGKAIDALGLKHPRDAAKLKTAASVEERLDILLEKEANILGTAANALMRTPRWGGAAVGAGMGAVRYMGSNDPNKTFLGSVAGGAALGAGAQHGLRAGVGALTAQAGRPGMVGQAGTHLQNAMRAAPRPAAPAAAATSARAQGMAAMGMTPHGASTVPTTAMSGNQMAQAVVDRRASILTNRSQRAQRAARGATIPGAAPQARTRRAPDRMGQLNQQLKLASARLRKVKRSCA